MFKLPWKKLFVWVSVRIPAVFILVLLGKVLKIIDYSAFVIDIHRSNLHFRFHKLSYRPGIYRRPKCCKRTDCPLHTTVERLFVLFYEVLSYDLFNFTLPPFQTRHEISLCTKQLSARRYRICHLQLCLIFHRLWLDHKGNPLSILN